jgi:hypothetical protein
MSLVIFQAREHPTPLTCLGASETNFWSLRSRIVEAGPFSDSSPVLRALFAGPRRSAVARQPVGTGSALIRWSIAPNRRRGRMTLGQQQPVCRMFVESS